MKAKQILKEMVDWHNENADLNGNHKYEHSEVDYYEMIVYDVGELVDTIEYRETRYGFGFVNIYKVEHNGEIYYFGVDAISVGRKADIYSYYDRDMLNHILDYMPRLYEQKEKLVKVYELV